jgi:cellulose synthase/poly-beta-1,6-N-acetylglucosamine synthase-like glycosyltransferase
MARADELIVIDNGSSDDTAAIARKFDARVVDEPVRGRSRARNRGIQIAGGELLVFLDADCRPASNWLSQLLEPFGDPKIGCVAGEIQLIYDANELGAYLNSKGHLSQAVNFNHQFLPYAGSGNVAFRRAVLKVIGGFDEALYSGHDADICWRMQLETDYQIVLATEAAVDHFQSLTLRALVRQKRRHAYGSVLLFKKYRCNRESERRSAKLVYWEYCSILRRGFDFIVRYLGSLFGAPARISNEQKFQLLLEVGDKLGRIEGSIGLRVWYP